MQANHGTGQSVMPLLWEWEASVSSASALKIGEVYRQMYRPIGWDDKPCPTEWAVILVYSKLEDAY